MIEREMGNRGSKSPGEMAYKEKSPLELINLEKYANALINVLIVIGLSYPDIKEQRVDGSYHIRQNLMFFRYTLKGFERNYLIRIPSNQNINNKRFLSFKMARQNKSTLITTQLDFKSSMNPWFVTGFSDAEGCFSISVLKNEKRTLGMSVQLMFKINLHKKDQALLKQIQSFFCVGGIHFKTSQSLQFQVSSIKDLKVIIDHFDKYPLITKKFSDYKLFKEAFYLVQNQEHLTMEGLRKVVAIRASINWGLPLELKTAFMDITPVERPIVLNKKIPDPNWLAGFISGEGCLSVGVTESVTHLTGFKVFLIFTITQHYRDEKLIRSFIDYFHCGKVYKKGDAYDFRVTKFSDFIEKIIPFLQKYPILGKKALDFQNLCKVAELINKKAHLTKEGLNQIRQIKVGMNKNR